VGKVLGYAAAVKPPSMRPAAPSRRDSRLTYDKLIQAAERLLDRYERRGFNLTQVAQEAEVSTATVYRYFNSTDALVEAYLDDFAAELGARRAARPAEERTGVRGLETLADDYVAIVLRRGRAMVHGRSLEGLLQRQAAGDPVIGPMWAIYAEPIESALDELGIPRDRLPFAVVVWNALFYARELLDLRDSLGWSADTISRRLTAAYLAAIRA